MPFFMGTGNKCNFGEQGTLEIKCSIFCEQGNRPIYFRGTREQVPPEWASIFYFLRAGDISCRLNPKVKTFCPCGDPEGGGGRGFGGSHREQQRRIPACASAQSVQRLCYSLIGKYHINT